MAAYNIYGYDSTTVNTDVPPLLTIVLSDDDSEFMGIENDSEGNKDEVEDIIRNYISVGLTPMSAVFRFAGSYGKIEEVVSYEGLA